MTNKLTTYKIFLYTAKQQHTEGDYSEAVILAQTAAELFIEQAFDALFIERKIEYLKKSVERLLYHNYNLAHDKVASLYEALADDRISQQPFWSQYKAHNELRNDVVHQGRAVTADEAAQSIAVVEQLINHIENAGK